MTKGSWMFWLVVMIALFIIAVKLYRNGKTYESRQRAPRAKLPRALCTSCGRTVATTERNGVQRFRAHRTLSSGDAPMCERSRKIVGDETGSAQLDIIDSGLPNDYHEDASQKPKPHVPSGEVADESFGPHSSFKLPKDHVPAARQLWRFGNGDIITREDESWSEMVARHGAPSPVIIDADSFEDEEAIAAEVLGERVNAPEQDESNADYRDRLTEQFDNVPTLAHAPEPT